RLHGLFAGGTLAQEALLGLLPWLGPIASNLSLPGALPLADPAAGGAHLLLDLGADELTLGRPHPMLDEGVRHERLAAAAIDPAVGLVLLDIVLGDGAHPDPAGELAPAIRAARQAAAGAGRPLDVVAILVGTDDDPQGLGAQAERLQAAGARVVRSVGEAVQYAVATLSSTTGESAGPPVPLDALAAPVVVNVGLEGFHRALAAQGARSIQVDWRPPAGGDERLGRLLERMR
ncbi:MAG TPA: protein FdrA, partial [Thermoanaerobaculia bacterium]|nr:protein FdrA [Thermoanaerobaculia bacterium]